MLGSVLEAVGVVQRMVPNTDSCICECRMESEAAAQASVEGHARLVYQRQQPDTLQHESQQQQSAAGEEPDCDQEADCDPEQGTAEEEQQRHRVETPAVQENMSQQEQQAAEDQQAEEQQAAKRSASNCGCQGVACWLPSLHSLRCTILTQES